MGDGMRNPMERAPGQHEQLRVLNVGGGNKAIKIPDHYAGWDHVLLDIDPAAAPDVVCDARLLDSLEPHQYDAVYCSHNLEHYYRHDAAKVLRGFVHVLTPDGVAEIRVPDIRYVMKYCVDKNLDIDDTLYMSAAGPITVGDVIYGWALQIERSGVDFFAHKAGYTTKSLTKVLSDAGFERIYIAEKPELFEVSALAFKREPTPRQIATFGL